MRLLILVFSLFLSATTVLAQTKKKPPKVHVKLCSHEVATDDPRYVSCELTTEEIIKCKTLKTSHPDYVIKSFHFSYQTPYKTIAPETKIEGNEFTEEMIAHIKRYKPNKIWITKIGMIDPECQPKWTRSLTINVTK